MLFLYNEDIEIDDPLQIPNLLSLHDRITLAALVFYTRYGEKYNLLFLYLQIEITMDSQKALRDEYKQKKFRIGVFQLRHLDNQKILIGKRES